MNMRFFDFEVFPDWWLCVFGDLPEGATEITESIKDKFYYVTSFDSDCRNKLLKNFEGAVMTGYNIKGYDLIIANAIYQGFNPQQVKIINDLIINKGCWYDSKEHIRLQPFVKKRLPNVIFQDLLDDNNGSLKEKEAILGLNILESSVDFNKENCTDEEIEEVIYYCKHDVYACMYYYLKVMEGYVKNKLAIGREFNIPEKDCYASTNAKLVSKALKSKRQSFGDEEITKIFLPEKIKNYVQENLPSGVLDKLLNNTEPFHVRLFNNEVDFGNGGIHSVYRNNLYVEQDKEYMLMNVDASSYYASMLIQFDCLSRTVSDPKNFKDIFDKRIELKHKKNKTQEEEDSQLANKLVLNTTFGASGNKYLDLYDPYMCTRCCRLGQIFLASFACKLVREIPNLTIIQTNTDGVLAYFKRDDLFKVREFQQEWTKVSGIMMEEDIVYKIWQRDVNNYLMLKESKKAPFDIKRKGLWLMETWTKPGYFLISPLTGYASSKAAIDYLVYGKDIVQSIVENKNILDFAITCKKGPTFRGVVQRFSDGTEKELFKCNRVIASKDESLGYIYKTKMYKGKLSYYKMPNIPEHCKTINYDLSTYDFDKLKKELDYMYYINRLQFLLLNN